MHQFTRLRTTRWLSPSFSADKGFVCVARKNSMMTGLYLTGHPRAYGCHSGP